MSPSLKYLMVSSIAARNASSDPMSLTATLGVELACVLLVMCGLAPDADRESLDTPQNRAPQNDQKSQDLPEPARADHGTPGGRQPGHMTCCQVTTTERTRTRRSVQDMRAGSEGQFSPVTIGSQYRRSAGSSGSGWGLVTTASSAAQPAVAPRSRGSRGPTAPRPRDTTAGSAAGRGSHAAAEPPGKVSARLHPS